MSEFAGLFKPSAPAPSRFTLDATGGSPQPLVGFKAPMVSEGSSQRVQTLRETIDALKTGNYYGAGLVQGVPRIGGSVALEAGNRFGDIASKIQGTISGKEVPNYFANGGTLSPDPQASQTEKNIFGTLFGPSPIESYSTRVQNLATENPLHVPNRFGLPTAIGIVGSLGGDALNFLGGEEAGAKNFIKGLAAENDALKVGEMLAKKGYAQDIIEAYAPKIAATSDVKVIENAINKATDLQLSTKAGNAFEAAKTVPATEATDATKIVTGKERGFITSVKEELPALRVAGEYIPRDTDTLMIKASNLIKDDLVAAERVAQETTDRGIATATQLLKHYAAEAETATSEAAKTALLDKAAILANETATRLTEAGRSVQAASILSRLTPEGQVRFAAREIQKYNEAVDNAKGGVFGLQKKIPELTGDQAKQILDEMKAIDKMPNGTEKAIRFQNLQNSIKDLVPSKLIDKLITVWKAGLLTGIKTSGTNIFANLSHGIAETAKDIPAKLVDSVVSLFTGEKTIGGMTTKGSFAGTKTGFQKGLQYIRTGFDERDIGIKLDWKRVNFGKGPVAKAIQTYEESVFHVLGAEDQPFYYGAKARSLADQAIAQAKNAGLKGEEAKAFVDNLISNPTDKMIKYATLDAETAVFQNATALARAAKTIQRIGGGVGEFVLPFGKTPSAVAMQVVNYSPAGIVKTIVENIGKGKFDQRLFAQGMGRAITGTAVMYIGGKLFDKGMISLDRPTTEKEQKLWELEGRTANSIKIGGKWRSAQVLGPLGNVLVIGGHYADELKKSGSPTEALKMATIGGLKSFTEQTFLQGVDQLLGAITDPARNAPTYFSSQFSSIIPTIVSDTARATDSKERLANGIMDKIKAKIPFLRNKLEPQVDVLGKPRDSVGNPLEIMADPTRPSKVVTTPVISELRRLSDAGFSVSPSLLGDKNGYKSLTKQQNTQLWERAGQIVNAKLESLFTNQEYQKLPDDKKAKAVDSVVTKSQTAARAEKVLELTKGLSGDALKKKLKELKDSKLMSSDVFDLYVKIR